MFQKKSVLKILFSLKISNDAVVVSEKSFKVYSRQAYIASAKSQSVRGASHQPAFMDSCLTISHTCLPCLPSASVSPGVLYLSMIEVMVASLTFFRAWWAWLKFYGELVLLYGMDMEFKDKIMLHCFREIKYRQGFTTEIRHWVYNVLG